MKKMYFHFAFITLFIFGISNIHLAQGDGPRSHLLAPKGVWGLNVKWLNLKQNISANGDLFFPSTDLTINSNPITLFHTFEAKGKYFQALAMINPTTVKSKIFLPNGNELTELREVGLSDGFVGLKMGILGAPALTLEEFLEHKSRFSMFGYFRTWYSGSYSEENLFNIGTNRITFEFLLPMTLPVFKGKITTWLEITPSIKLFTVNSGKVSSNTFEERRQNPLFIIENHLSHNFTKKLWSTLSLRYQYGGETKTDGLLDDNQINLLGAGIGLGYQVAPFLGISIDYGDILYGKNDVTSRMIRLSAVLSYLKIDKKPSTQ